MVDGRESWQLDELAHAGRENLDPAHVARYDQKEDGAAADELRVLAALGVDGRSTVIDMGTGTGQFAVAAAPAVRRVIAVDVSPEMLEHLRAKLRRMEVQNVECVLAGFLTYEHRGERADLLYSRYALHHLPDFWKGLALVRIAGMLAPGGILRLSDVVYSFDPAHARARLQQWISETATPTADGGWTRAELEEHVRNEHSTFTWLLEPMLAKAGFVIEQRDYSEDQIFARYTCVKASRI